MLNVHPTCLLVPDSVSAANVRNRTRVPQSLRKAAMRGWRTCETFPTDLPRTIEGPR